MEHRRLVMALLPSTILDVHAFSADRQIIFGKVPSSKMISNAIRRERGPIPSCARLFMEEGGVDREKKGATLRKDPADDRSPCWPIHSILRPGRSSIPVSGFQIKSKKAGAEAQTEGASSRKTSMECGELAGIKGWGRQTQRLRRFASLPVRRGVCGVIDSERGEELAGRMTQFWGFRENLGIPRGRWVLRYCYCFRLDAPASSSPPKPGLESLQPARPSTQQR